MENQHAAAKPKHKAEWTPEFSREVANRLEEAVFEKLSALNVPDEVFTLLHCASFFRYIQANPDDQHALKDLPGWQQDALTALLQNRSL